MNYFVFLGILRSLIQGSKVAARIYEQSTPAKEPTPGRLLTIDDIPRAHIAAERLLRS